MTIAKRHFRLEDALRLRSASDPDLSPDGLAAAFTHTQVDQEADRFSSSIWVAAVEGSAPPRRFTEGPADRSARFSPDGRWLAYISVTDGEASHAHLRLASLQGGMPMALGDLPGPISGVTWSPDSTRVAVICRLGVPDPTKRTTAERNAPRVLRGLGARLDGTGWQDGRRHLFVVDLDGRANQVTRGEYDHADPAFSPDGATLVFSADRHPRRDDRQIRSDAWVVPATGGRPVRLTNGQGRAAFPTFSPDGATIAFAGQITDSWDADSHVFVMPADGSREPEMVAPDLDRGVILFPGLPSPYCWVTHDELLVLFANRGAVTLHRVRIGERRGRVVVGGATQVDGLAARPGRRAVAFTASWPDRPSEVFIHTLGRGQPKQLTGLNEDLLAEVELSPLERSTIVQHGTEVEYFTVLPPGGAPRRLPLHLDIHGGPHGMWPSGRFIGMHQALAGAGYAVVLPNPRGSSGYGQAFTEACTGDWGGGDCEDILACCDDLIRRGVADGDRLFLGGASYGGFMTAWIVGHHHRFRAATAVAAVIDQTAMALTCDIPDFAQFNMGGNPWERPDEYQKRSPLTYLPEVTTPVLVVHWEGDIRVPIGQGEELYTGLRVLGKESRMVRYPGGFHIMRTPSQAVDWVRQTLTWNQEHDRPRAASGRRRR